ncbi:STAS-like domain-containing protein [Mucilaginibacter calamicampi]|uniref:STAS-like domain-containing protein n=1 Tax=Mucilaginibacter calamicampi TaxID=1302352 RepID=A0ABW2YSB2_9SPHI
MILIVKDILGSNTALSTDAGGVLFTEIHKALSGKQDIKLDFRDVEVMSSAFLNVAIGQLYHAFGPDELNEHLKIVNLPVEDRALLKKVIDRAKEYFSDQKAFDQRMNDLYGDN